MPGTLFIYVLQSAQSLRGKALIRISPGFPVNVHTAHHIDRFRSVSGKLSDGGHMCDFFLFGSCGQCHACLYDCCASIHEFPVLYSNYFLTHWAFFTRISFPWSVEQKVERVALSWTAVVLKLNLSLIIKIIKISLNSWSWQKAAVRVSTDIFIIIYLVCISTVKGIGFLSNGTSFMLSLKKSVSVKKMIIKKECMQHFATNFL